MYEIRSISTKAFVEDNAIILPRFQRKQTWKEKDNFQFCISVFKNYPLGVCIEQTKKKGKYGDVEKILLDGRQRRNALKKISESPDNIYEWAKSYIGIKQKMQPSDLTTVFLEKIDEYLDMDEKIEKEELIDDGFTALEGDSSDTTFVDGKYDEDNIKTEIEESCADNSILLEKNSNLQLLLAILKICHDGYRNNRYSGFSKPFAEINTYFKETLDFAVVEDGKEVIHGESLKAYLSSYKLFIQTKRIKNDADSFCKYVSNGKIFKDDKKKQRFNVTVNSMWDEIEERIKMYDRIDNILDQSKIGIIDISEITIRDAQKIFNIINTKGIPLTAAEILSASPEWNTQVLNPSKTVIDLASEMYRKNQIEFNESNIVKWDYPATFFSYMKQKAKPFYDLCIFDDLASDSQITLGFKLLSGIFLGGIKKDDVGNLADKVDNFSAQVDIIIGELNELGKILKDYIYFKNLHSFNKSVKNLLSDAIVLEFMTVMYKEYKRLGYSGKEQIKREAFILFDRLVYEYTLKNWRGSSDGKFANDLQKYNRNPVEFFNGIPESTWKTLISQINEYDIINNEKIETYKRLEPILYHLSCIMGLNSIKSLISDDLSFEIDHIYPQELFRDTDILKDRENSVHSLFNLCLIPKSINAKKSNGKLIDLGDDTDKDIYSYYSGLEVKDFEKYSKASNFFELQKARGESLLDGVTTKRTQLLNKDW